MPTTEYDYIIVGSGIAGLYTALLAREVGSVLIITKGSIDDCNTKYAQGGIAAAVGHGDSPQLHFQDTVAAGAGLCDPEAVRILVDEAAERITDLIRFGVRFDTVEGEVALAKEAAHSASRVLHAGGDATGEHIELSLSHLARLSRITILEHCLATEIIVEDGIARGVVAFDARTNAVEKFYGRFLVMATGGAGRLYKFTTNSDIATGDGVALAFHAGAEIADMEFFQFHPTALRLPGVHPFLISEAVRGEGGILRNAEGKAFMLDYSPNGDLAPRDVVARAILFEMQKAGTDWVFLDITHLPPKTITARFPHIYRFCLDQGLDITTNPIPVAPAAHYMMGGVKTNTWGETSVPGLFAAGETACTGVHGANRLASNSLLEVLVFSKRIIQRTKNSSGYNPSASVTSVQEVFSLSPVKPKISLTLGRYAVQSLMWEKVGIIRSGDGLKYAQSTLRDWEAGLDKALDRSSYELRNLLLIARLATEAALIREESRGAHYRLDFPQPSPQWERHIVFKKAEL
ncbi:MAG: L-aspartate oxidase [Chloroflexi bacterium]|nr:L-aspartate oxidase [Chloroflexota bacterium]